MSDLSDLMGTDPLKLTREDRKPIIQFYRDNREKFLQGQKTEKAEKKPAVPKGSLSLKDLNL